MSASRSTSLEDFSIEEDGVSVSDVDECRVPEEDGVAIARPPRSAATSDEVIVSGQAALDVLNILQNNGQVGRERASNLQRKYLILKETLDNSRATEATLLAQVKQLGQVVTQQHHVLERGASFPDGDSGEPARLRQILLTHNNQLEQSLQRLSVLNTQLTSVEEEHGQVSRELERLPRQTDMEAQVANLNCQLEDIRDEIKKRSRDIQHYTNELASRGQRLSIILQDTEELKSTDSALQDELISIRCAPGNLPREIDSIHKRYKDTKLQVSETCKHLTSLTDQQKELQLQHEAIQLELKEAKRKLEDIQEEGNRLSELERQEDKSLARAKERQTELLEQQANLELTLHHRRIEYNRLYEASVSFNKDIERIVRQVKKAELLVESIKQSETQLNNRVDGLQVNVDDSNMVINESQRRQHDLREEVEILRKGLNMQDGVSSAQRAVLDEKLKEEEKMRAKLTTLTDKLQHLNKKTVSLTRERDILSRSCHQAKLTELGTQANLCTQDAQHREQKKIVTHLQQKLADFAEAYKIIKTERNHTHSHIQKLQQLSSEMREKWRVLENEAEVLTTSVQDKEKLLQRCSLLHSIKTMERDSQRQTGSKLTLEITQTKAELEAQRETLGKLTHQISSLEQQLNQMRKNYEHALQERNDTGLQLIERNEEVCVFHERLNMQEAVLRQASVDLMTREEEIRYLNMEIAQLKTHILVGRKRLPEQSHLQQDLDSAQIQLRECESELRSLESQVENAQDPSRVRLLPGPQASQDELRAQLESLEERLASLEQTGLEKELLHEQVCRLVDRSKTRADTHKESTLEVAQRVSQYQSKIKDTTHKTMALVSELTMQQANALRLHHEVREKEGAIERAYLRLQAGQPPDDSIEQQWLQLIEEKQQLKDKTLRMKLMSSENETTAEQRPNAYLPTGDNDLPIPKPYGNHAPFKPSPAGANMRHIRKPQPKPIDI